MNALLLSAGLGTRLRPLTDHTPKCLVDIAHRPLLDYWLHDLHAAGFEKFLINTHHLPDQVDRFVQKHALQTIIKLVHETALLGTAGTLLANRSFLAEGTTLVAHADNLCLCSWRDFIAAHKGRPRGTIMTMMTFEAESPEQCGIVQTTADGIVHSFHEKVPNPPGNLANAAVYLIEPEVIKFMEGIEPPVHDLSTQVIPRLLGRIHTWHNRDTLIDIGSPERLASGRVRAASMQVSR